MPFLKIGKLKEKRQIRRKLVLALILLVVPILAAAGVVFDLSAVPTTQAALGIKG
ncbi:MAG: hypothetical protein Q7K65_05475 [Candidatus Buchananbacteria bacterium]|nr:hypothetical protein [Candidatus Buchananbacteria bacterium]